MIILLTLIATVITGVPLAAVALVTVASWREETARSIAGRAPGPLTGAARRLLAFHATGIGPAASQIRARRRGRNFGQPAGGDILPSLSTGTGANPGTGTSLDTGTGTGTGTDLVLAEDDDLMLAGGS